MELMKQLQDCGWKTFEQLITEVFERHHYASFWNVNLTIEGRRRQYDIIAVKGDKCVIVDCKKWDNRISRVSALKTAVEKHKQRCQFYNLLMQKTVTPVIITYNEEPILEYEHTYIVPLNRLNDFLLKS